MKHTINYAGLTDGEQRTKALKDCEAYLGAAQYRKVMEALRYEKFRGVSEDYLLGALAMLAGIEGLPARVMIEEA